jgi:environmental stress-induced protein Ves
MSEVSEATPGAGAASYQTLPWGGHREMPWRNHGGSTLEVARVPSSEARGPLEWRVSVARIVRAGPFSKLPGIDRIIMPIGDAGLSLFIDRVKTVLDPWQHLAFPGEAAVFAEVLGGPTPCLNLMTRRGGPDGAVTMLPGRNGEPVRLGTGDQAVVVAVSGSASVHDHAYGDVTVVGLRPMDAVLATGPGTFEVSAEGPVAVVTVGGAQGALPGRRWRCQA